MPRKSLRPEMPDGEMGVETKTSHQFNKERDRELVRSELPRKTDMGDIRFDGTHGEPFTSSAQKNVKKEFNEKRIMPARVSHDDNLNADTTMCKENTITKAPQAQGDAFAKSGRNNVNKESDKKRTFSAHVLEKDRQFNS